MKELILASNSPRRKEILEKFNYKFQIINSDYKEENAKNLKNDDVINSLIKNNCYCKAYAVSNKIASQAIVIGADTVVTLDSVCLLKPCDFSEAFYFLKKLSGKPHIVKTAIALVCGEKSLIEIFETKVYFRKLNENEIENYIKSCNPLDKAGSYGIQDFIKPENLNNPPETSFIQKIEGSYYNVMGICPFGLKEMLSKFN